jgi:hypothetical protein
MMFYYKLSGSIDFYRFLRFLDAPVLRLKTKEGPDGILAWRQLGPGNGQQIGRNNR